MAESPFIASVAEFFTLRAAAQTVDRVSEQARKRIHEALLLGRQKATCAETLWANGHTAEGLALAAAALRATLAAAPSLAPGAAPPSPKTRAEAGESKAPDAKAEDAEVEDAKADGAKADGAKAEDAKAEDAKAEGAKAEGAKVEVDHAEETKAPDAGWDDALRARGVSKADLEAIRSASSRASEKLPLLDRDVSPGHAELFVDLMRARQRADRAIAPGAMTHGDLRWTRVLRGAAAALVAAATAAGLYYGLRTPTGIFATASAILGESPQFAPEMAIDGSPATFWLLPDGSTGWLEVSASPPRHVERIRVLNTTNPPWTDRGTREYRLEVYANGALARTIDGTFEWTDTPVAVQHPLDLDGVERVRFVVRSHHRVGAGLAELSLE